MKCVAVSACITGVAHTWMAQKALTKYAAENGIDLKMEVQSSIGIENKLNQKDIDEADVVIFACDVAVREPDRFEGKKILKTRPGDVIKHPDETFKKAEQLCSNAA